MENSSSGLKKGPWTPEEDQKLIHYIQIHGRPANWLAFPKYAGLQRCGKSCRLRWMNYLRPGIKRGSFSSEEEDAIIQLHRALGNKWSAIASRLPGRTDNEIKNYWNTHIKKRLIGMGLDPITHTPRLDLMDFSSLVGSAQLSLTSWLGLQALINHPELLRIAAATLLSNNNTSRSLEVLQSNDIDPDQSVQLDNNTTASNTQVLQVNHELAQPEKIMITDLHDSPSSNAIDNQAKTTMIATYNNHYVDDGQSWKDIQDNEFLLLSGVDQISSSSTGYNPIRMADVSHDDNSFFGSLINSCDHQGTEDIDHETDNGYFSNMLHFDIPQNPDFDDFM